MTLPAPRQLPQRRQAPARPAQARQRSAPAPLEEHTAIIQQVNARGIMLDGQWLNWSKDFRGDIPEVEPGDEITVRYSVWDDKGWILEADCPAAAPPSQVPADIQAPHLSQRDWVSFRQSALKHAAHIVAAQLEATEPESQAGQLARAEELTLNLAAGFFEWLTEPR